MCVRNPENVSCRSCEVSLVGTGRRRYCKRCEDELKGRLGQYFGRVAERAFKIPSLRLLIYESIPESLR